MTVGAGAIRIFRASNACSIGQSRVFALHARATGPIATPSNRGTAAFAVGNLTRGTRLFAIIVVACRARFAFAGQRIGFLTVGTAFGFFAITAAKAVGNAVARAIAFFVFVARQAGTAVFFIILSRRTGFRTGTVTTAAAVGHLRPRTVAGIAVFTDFAFAVFANFARTARRIRAGANRRMVFDHAFRQS